MKAPVYSATGTKSADVTLDAKVFGLTPNTVLLSEAYRIAQGNKRTNNAATLTRGLVSGGGKKPFRQKGTGRARTGSTRNPLWRGGGTIFGPTGIENYNRTMPAKARRSALLNALSAQAENVVVIEAITIEKPKTKEAAALLAKLGVEGRIMVVVASKQPAVVQSFANLAGVTLVSPNELTADRVLDADKFVIEKEALTTINKLGSVK